METMLRRAGPLGDRLAVRYEHGLPSIEISNCAAGRAALARNDDRQLNRASPVGEVEVELF